MNRIFAFLVSITILLSASTVFAYTYTSSCGAANWASLPVSYWMNEDGSEDFDFNTLHQIMDRSFAEWGKPCCSEFSARYKGTTTNLPIPPQNSQNPEPIILAWEDKSWPTILGDVKSVIGVTLPQFYTNCTIAYGPIYFNGVGFTFRNNGRETDMESIATHEIGHLLGLGHSNSGSATMYYAHRGGTGARSLSQDDEDGVCSLYNVTCNCQTATDCKTGQDCINARCVDIPCSASNPCENGKECNAQSGECEIPRCNNTSDCESGFECASGHCRSTCPSCRTCNADTDCGGKGRCFDIGTGKKCLFGCENENHCQGDSTCTQWQFNTQNGPQVSGLCSAPGNQENPCPEAYICKVETTPKDECQTDNDCPGSEECVPNGGIKKCQTPADPCESVTCGADQTCKNGTCIDNKTDECQKDKDCGNTQQCVLNDGHKVCQKKPNQCEHNSDCKASQECISSGGTKECRDRSDPCFDISCDANHRCEDGTCVAKENSNNMPGTMNPTTPDEEDTIIIFKNSSNEGCGCSAGPGKSIPGGLLLFIAFLIGTRKRRPY